jgi:hypothetical protein
VHVGIVKGANLPTNATIINTSTTQSQGNPLIPYVTSFIPNESLGANFANLHHFYVATDPHTSLTTAEALVLEAIEALVGTTLEEVEFVAHVAHEDMSPRVGGGAAKAGFYDELYALQGESNTFYTGRYMSAQTAQPIWMHFENLVLPELLASLAA